ncbi:MAG: two-component regulator propeller domain-containing protein, partial [Spirochaetales bacterium]|nr:two-component regulator propeller domain-containing protein [Spirochaetales bacterium]
VTGFPLPGEAGVRAVLPNGDYLWVGTERSGLYIYQFINETWEILNETNSTLSYDKIRSLYRDEKGLIWIGTRGGGINLFNPETTLITTWMAGTGDERDLSSPYIRQMEERFDGSIWTATDGGSISIIRTDGTVRQVSLPAEEASGEHDQVYSLLEDSSGRLWIGTDGAGLYTILPGGSIDDALPFSLESPAEAGQGRETIWFISESSDSSIWIGTEGLGLYRINGDDGGITRYTHKPGNLEGLNGNAVRCIFEDSRQQIWVGTWDGGLNLYDKEKDLFRSFTRSPNLTGSLSDTSVNTIFEDRRGRLWVGTGGGGISIFHPQEGIFRTISSRDGLAGDNIYGILDDEEGNIWASTDKGLSRISLYEEKIRNFSRADGLAGNEFSQNAYLKTSQGRLFWGGNHGISAFNPQDLNFDEKPQGTIRFTGLWIHNLPVRIGQSFYDELILDRDLSLKQGIHLPYEGNNLTIRFSILSYIDPSKHQYTAQLEGIEERPRFLGNSNEVSYASLPPGEYRLKITGTDNNGLYAEAWLGVVVETPFWMHIWFYVLSVLVFLLLLSIIIFYRLRNLARSNDQLRSFTMHMEKAREEERKAAARDYHDELGQLLTAMKFDLFWLNSHPDSDETVRKEKISSLLEIVNDAISSVRVLSTNIRPKALDNLTLTEALEWQSRRFRKRTGIELDLDIKIKGKVFTEEDIDRKTALFRMYQEILTNIIRHSEASRVTVNVYLEDSKIYLRVRDNGKGIPKNAKRREDSFGLIGMRERCRHFNGTFTIENHPDGGTLIKITLPLRDRKQERSSHA